PTDSIRPASVMDFVSASTISWTIWFGVMDDLILLDRFLPLPLLLPFRAAIAAPSPRPADGPSQMPAERSSRKRRAQGEKGRSERARVARSFRHVDRERAAKEIRNCPRTVVAKSAEIGEHALLDAFEHRVRVLSTKRTLAPYRFVQNDR